MEFFSKMGETISIKGRDLTKKAKEIAEVSSLYGQVSTQEERINHIFHELGRVFYEEHKELAEGPVAEKFRTVDDAYAEIDRLQLEILRVKGVQRCPGCGSAVSLEASFCPNCGEKMPEKAPEAEPEQVTDGEASVQEVFCTACQAKLEPDALFCPECGAKQKEAGE